MNISAKPVSKLLDLAASMPYAHYLGLAPKATSVKAVTPPLKPKPFSAAPTAENPAASRTAPSAAGASPKKADAADAIKADRARCAQIVAHGLNSGCVHQAASLAFDTDLTAIQAISALKAATADAPRRGRERMGLSGLSNEAAPMSSAAAAQAIVEAGERAQAASSPKK